MIDLTALTGYFARVGQGILQMRRDRLFGVSLWTGGLPDANAAPYALAADETDGVQVSQPDGLGGFAWGAAGGISQADADTRYVNTAGDTMTGDLTMQSGGSDLTLDTYATSGSTQSILSFRKSRSATVGTQTVVAANDLIGRIAFAGSDGTNFEDAARIEGTVDTTPGNDDMPGRLTFSTSVDGSAAPDEKLRINRGGVFINDNGNDYDTRIEGDTDQNLVFVDAGNDRVGIGNSSPATKLDVRGLVTQADPTDPTRQMTFALSGISASTTRTLTVPDASGTVALAPTITTRTNTSASIANGATGSVTASCTSGEVRLGGGYAHSVSLNTAGVYTNRPGGTSDWVVEVRNATGGAMTVTAYVVCAKFGA